MAARGWSQIKQDTWLAAFPEEFYKMDIDENGFVDDDDMKGYFNILCTSQGHQGSGLRGTSRRVGRSKEDDIEPNQYLSSFNRDIFYFEIKPL